MTVQLVGEIVEVSFERGVSQYPSINDEAHLVTEADLERIYGSSDKSQISIGRLAAAESIPVLIDLDKLVTRHSAVLGSTGSGKSTTVASLLRSITKGRDDSNPFPSSRILLLDVHGEYAAALGDIAKVFKVNSIDEETRLVVPFWAIEISELLTFAMGKLEEKAYAGVVDKVFDAKLKVATAANFKGVDLNSLTVDSPVPFSLKQLWLELLDPEVRTWNDAAKTTPALQTAGDAQTLTAPKYLPPATGNNAPFVNSIGVLSIRKQLSLLRSRLLDRQFDFMFHPGEWEPNLDGTTTKDLPQLLASWLGHDKPVTVLDLSGVPSQIMTRMVGGILNIIYQSLFWGRDLPEGGRSRPELIVMEEAHRYLGKDTNSPAREMVQRIVKEGRKFGIGAMVVSQRPSEIDDTILSQCGTFFALRLSNSADRAHVQSALPDSLSGVVDSLPVLRTGEAIVIGEAARLPVRCRIAVPKEAHRPDSGDPLVAEAWSKERAAEDYDNLVATWRSQDSQWKPKA